MLYLVMLYTLSTFPLTTYLLTYLPPFLLLTMRMICAGASMLAYHYFWARSGWQLRTDHWRLYLHVLLFAVFVPYALRYHGILYTPTPHVFAWYNIGPLVTYLLTGLWGTERITWQRTNALAIGFFGVLVMSGISLSSCVTTPLNLGDLALFASVISFSWGWIVMRKLVVELGYAPAMANGLAMLAGGLLGLGATVSLESTPSVPDYVPFAVILGIFIILSTIITHNLYATLMRHYSLTLIQTGYWLTPVITHVGQVLFLHKSLSPLTLSSGFLIGIGFYLLYRQEKLTAGITRSYPWPLN